MCIAGVVPAYSGADHKRGMWCVHFASDTSKHTLEALQEDIKRHLFTIVISAPANIRKQLNEALGIIAKSDFHERWPGLLPELVANLDKPGTQIAVFEAMAAVFKPLREVTIDDCDETMDYCQKGAAAKVLEVVQVHFLRLIRVKPLGLQSFVSRSCPFL